MAWSIVQQNEAAQNTGLATVSATLLSAATAGNLILVVVGADAYASTPPTGFTESTGCKQQTNLGHYVWWKVAAGGETSVSYTIGSASTSCWEIFEISGLTGSPYDISNGTFLGTGLSTMTTPTITPTAGERLIVASIGGSTSAANFTGLSAWLNSFVEQDDTTNTKASGTRDIIGMATLSATAGGSTGYSSGATYSPNATARTGIIIAFKVAAGGSAVPGTAVASFTLAAGASGVREVPAAAVTSLGFTATASGAREVIGAAFGPFAFTAAAAGVVSIGPSSVSGTAAAVLTFAGSATGTATSAGQVSGVASGSLLFSASASGVRAVPGAAAAPLGFTAAAFGVPTVPGMAAAAFALTAVAAGAGSTPGAVIVRPNAGLVVRPSSGLVARPDTGVVVRP